MRKKNLGKKKIASRKNPIRSLPPPDIVPPLLFENKQRVNGTVRDAPSPPKKSDITLDCSHLVCAPWRNALLKQRREKKTPPRIAFFLLLVWISWTSFSISLWNKLLRSERIIARTSETSLFSISFEGKPPFEAFSLFFSPPKKNKKKIAQLNPPPPVQFLHTQSTQKKEKEIKQVHDRRIPQSEGLYEEKRRGKGERLNLFYLCNTKLSCKRFLWHSNSEFRPRDSRQLLITMEHST